MTTTQTAAAPATAWQIDPQHSSIEFAVRHLMISTVRGRFGTFSGSATGLDESSKAAGVKVSIDVASITTGIDQRDEHLRSADFFEVEKFPTIVFDAKRVEGPFSDEFTFVGDLTIRGVTREVTLKAESQGQTTDPWGNLRVGYSATGKLKRSDFGLTYNQALEAGGVLIGDDIKFTIDVALIQPPATTEGTTAS